MYDELYVFRFEQANTIVVSNRRRFHRFVVNDERILLELFICIYTYIYIKMTLRF